MQPTYHHPPFLKSSPNPPTDTQKAYMLYCLIMNAGLALNVDALFIEKFRNDEFAEMPKLLTCEHYGLATKSPTINNVRGAIQHNYGLSILFISDFGSKFVCHIHLGALQLSLTFDPDTFYQITATQSLDIEQIDTIIREAFLFAIETQSMFFDSTLCPKKEANVLTPYEIIEAMCRPIKYDVIPNLFIAKDPNLDSVVHIYFCFFECATNQYLKITVVKSSLSKIFPHIENAAELPRDPKNAIERFILND